MGTFRSAGGTAARRPQRGTRARLRIPGSPEPRAAAPAAPAARAIGRAARPPPPRSAPASLPARPRPSPLPALFSPFPALRGRRQPPARNGRPGLAPALGQMRGSSIHTPIHPSVLLPYRYSRCVRAQGCIFVR